MYIKLLIKLFNLTYLYLLYYCLIAKTSAFRIHSTLFYRKIILIQSFPLSILLFITIIIITIIFFFFYNVSFLLNSGSIEKVK